MSREGHETAVKLELGALGPPAIGGDCVAIIRYRLDAPPTK
jgi:hypothetical protein